MDKAVIFCKDLNQIRRQTKTFFDDHSVEFQIEADSLEIGDGFHTMQELYEHRHRLFICLMRLEEGLLKGSAWISKLHDDGSCFEGWFVAGLTGKNGRLPVTYHFPMRHWEEMSQKFTVLDKAPPWDGHTSADVLKRLKEY